MDNKFQFTIRTRQMIGLGISIDRNYTVIIVLCWQFEWSY